MTNPTSGTWSLPDRVIAHLQGAVWTSVLPSQVLAEVVAPSDCKLGGVQVDAQTAGSGTGSTVIDLLRNGASVWGSNLAGRPTLAAATSGAFVSQRIQDAAVKAGDVLMFQCVAVPSGSGPTGHGRVRASVALEGLFERSV